MKQTFAVAAAEFRSLRRTAQTWLVVAAAVGAGLAPFLYYSVAHGIRSGYGATAGSVSPRFLIHGFGDLTLLAIMAGVVLLALDALARDRRDGIDAAVAARPASNLSLVAGRTAGLVLAAWLAPALLALATLAWGGATAATGFWAGDFVEPWSLAAFLLVDAPVALLAWTALVVFLRVALGGAWAAAAAAFALLALQLWALFALPAWLPPVVSLLPRFAAVSSDVLPAFADGAVVQRFALLLLAGGALCLAAAALARRTRRDDGAAARAAAGAVLGSLGAAFLAFLLAQAAQERTERTGWIAAHQERQGAAGLDIEHLAAQVAIDPGRELRLHATLRVRTEEQKDALVFRFNPGMEIAHVRAAGETLAHRHESGLLDVRLARPLAAGEAVELSVLATGVPDPRFAYLDEALDPSSLALADSLLHTLGTEASIFESGYVALLPGVAWLPAAGSGFGAGPDFFDLSLEVDLPPGWLAAGPGHRTESPAPGGGRRVGFRPPAPVAEVAVLASDRFERLAGTVAGVDVDLLLHRQHMRNARFFRDAATSIRDHFGWRLAAAAERCLPYPYGRLSLVEVPARLRGFGGGQRMDSVLAAPGIVMVREHGFPTARFDFASRDYPSDLDLLLLDYLDSDYSSGDPNAGVARNHLWFRARVRGPAGSPLDLLLEALANRLAGNPRSHFSAQVFVGRMPHGIGARLIGRTMADTAPVHNALVDRQFRAAVRTADMSPAGSPAPVVADAASDAGYRRAAAMAGIIDVGLGEEKTGALLADILRRFDGRTFAMGDFLAAVRRLDAPLAETLGGQLRSAALPGFVHSPLEVVRIADDERGLPRYLSRLRVRNDERAPGVVLLLLYVRGESAHIGHASDPVHLAADEAVEIELTTPSPPAFARLLTFLSRNRGQVALGTPRPDSIPQTDDEPVGIRPSPWRPPRLDGVVVDDLDVGFAVRKVGGESPVFGAPRAQSDAAADTAESLAEAWWNVPTGRWGRQPVERGWGKYGATVVVAAQGDGTEEAVFTAKLPTAGRWRLHYDVPSDRSTGVDWTYGRLRWAGPRQLSAFETGFRLAEAGTYRMRLSAGADEFDIVFDAGRAGYGWHVLGTSTSRPGWRRWRSRASATAATTWLPTPSGGSRAGGRPRHSSGSDPQPVESHDGIVGTTARLWRAVVVSPRRVAFGFRRSRAPAGR